MAVLRACRLEPHVHQDRLSDGGVGRVLGLMGVARGVGVARRPRRDDHLLELVQVDAIDVSRLQVASDCATNSGHLVRAPPQYSGRRGSGSVECRLGG